MNAEEFDRKDTARQIVLQLMDLEICDDWTDEQEGAIFEMLQLARAFEESIEESE